MEIGVVDSEVGAYTDGSLGDGLARTGWQGF